MKKIFRKAWIGVIAVLALVVGSCCSQRNRGEIKVIKERIADLKEQLHIREISCVYGPPEMIREYGMETDRMREELESLEKELERLKKCK